jgi:hypothetical protein
MFGTRQKVSIRIKANIVAIYQMICVSFIYYFLSSEGITALKLIAVSLFINCTPYLNASLDLVNY